MNESKRFDCVSMVAMRPVGVLKTIDKTSIGLVPIAILFLGFRANPRAYRQIRPLLDNVPQENAGYV